MVSCYELGSGCMYIAYSKPIIIIDIILTIAVIILLIIAYKKKCSGKSRGKNK